MAVWRSRELEDVALFVNGLPVLIHFTLFQRHGFFTDDALGTPLALGLNMGHWITSRGEDNPYVSLDSDSRLINVARPPGMNDQDDIFREPIERIREEPLPFKDRWRKWNAPRQRHGMG